MLPGIYEFDVSVTVKIVLCYGWGLSQYTREACVHKERKGHPQIA